MRHVTVGSSTTESVLLLKDFPLEGPGCARPSETGSPSTNPGGNHEAVHGSPENAALSSSVVGPPTRTVEGRAAQGCPQCLPQHFGLRVSVEALACPERLHKAGGICPKTEKLKGLLPGEAANAGSKHHVQQGQVQRLRLRPRSQRSQTLVDREQM